MQEIMTDQEAIEAVKSGSRCKTRYTRPAESDKECSTHTWRTVACDGEEDVKECVKCGYQKVIACDYELSDYYLPVEGPNSRF